MSEVSQKKKKALARFRKTDNPAMKRAKALMEYLPDSSTLETQEFFRQEYSSVYRVILDALHQFDYKFINENQNVPMTEVINVLKILKKLMTNMENRIRQRWQARSISSLITELVMYDNNFQIRCHGVDLLMTFMDILRDVADNSVLLIFRHVVNFIPFCNPTKDKLKHWFSQKQLIGHSSVFSFAKRDNLEEVSDEDRCVEEAHLLQNVLAFTSRHKRSDHFQFWFNLLKVYIFPILYPAFCQNNGFYDNKDEKKTTGFRPEAPAQVQVIVVKWLIDAMEDKVLESNICGERENLNFVMEIFRQTFTLPIEYSEDIVTVIKCFEGWVKGKTNVPNLTSHIQHTMRMMMDHAFPAFCLISSQFEEPSTRLHSGSRRDTREPREQICLSVIRLYKLLANETKFVLSDSTWEHLLVTLLNATNYLVKTEEGENEKLVKPLIGCLFECYMLSRTRETLWEVLQEKVRSWTSCKAAVLEWTIKLKKLTQQLLNTLAMVTTHGPAGRPRRTAVDQSRHGKSPHNPPPVLNKRITKKKKQGHHQSNRFSPLPL